MRAFLPVEITTAKLISSSIAEPDTGEVVYNAESTYAADDYVIDATTHQRWISLQGGNTGNTPDPAADTAWWKRSGKSNRYRMFDWNNNAISSSTSPLAVTIAPGQGIDSVQIDGLSAHEVNIQVTDGSGGPVILDEIFDLQSRTALTPFEWSFTPFSYHESVATFNVPASSLDPYVTLTATGNDPVTVGRFGVGLSTNIGQVQWSTEIDSKSYSEVDRSTFGETTLLVQRGEIPSQDLKLLVDARRVQTLLRFKRESDARVVFWSALDDLDQPYSRPLLLVGIHRRFTIQLDNPNETPMNLRLEGI